MKYKILTQINEFLQDFKRISNIKRVGDRVILVEFSPKFELAFDLDRTNSAIYSLAQIPKKSYKAPFDTILSKRFNASKILEVKVPEANRVMNFKAEKQGSYKSLISYLHFEFTGRFTNAIITDEKGVILEALRHYENDKRAIKVGKIYTHLEPILIKEKPSEDIENFSEFFKNEFERLNLGKLENLKSSKILQVKKRVEVLKNTLESLESSENLLKKSEIYKEKAMLLTANLHLLNHHDRVFSLENFMGQRVEFSLEKSPKIEAKEMFNESRKLRQKASGVSLEVENLSGKIEFLENLSSLLKNAKTGEELETLLPKKQARKSMDRGDEIVENFYFGEFKISVGKNEAGNIALLKNSKKSDFWFHLKDRPSAHVIVKTNKQKLDIDTIYFAAKICVNFSVKESGKYLVDFTQRSNVKVVDKAFVNYTNFDTIDILKP